MISYWDTSAVINAYVSPHVWDKLDSGEHFTRSHMFAEFFSSMTGRGISVRDSDGNAVRIVLSPADAALWLREFSKTIKLVKLTPEETLTGLDETESLRVMGGRIYNYGHALAAKKAKADVILTRNPDDFKGLTGKTKVECP